VAVALLAGPSIYIGFAGAYDATPDIHEHGDFWDRFGSRPSCARWKVANHERPPWLPYWHRS
jgi:hypothetical protein